MSREDRLDVLGMLHKMFNILRVNLTRSSTVNNAAL